jgi:hypothetical protein
VARAGGLDLGVGEDVVVGAADALDAAGEGDGAATTAIVDGDAVAWPGAQLGCKATLQVPATRASARDVFGWMVNCVRVPLTSIVVIVVVALVNVIVSLVVIVDVNGFGADVHDTPGVTDPVKVMVGVAAYVGAAVAIAPKTIAEKHK